MFQQIPLMTNNQEFQIVLQVNSENRPFKFSFRWNKIAGYWVMTLIDSVTGLIVFDSIPLVTGQVDMASADILRAFGYLLVGTAYLIPVSTEPPTDYPNETNLETEFALLWDDNL